jgi:probable FeS assembly SUF system protein SufT
MSYDQIELKRDCEAVQIPQGNGVVLPAGTSAFITQSLGGSYTLQVPSMGGLFRVAGADADALGLEAVAAAPVAQSSGPVTAEAVWGKLRDVYDPEIPVNIVDLGLVYDMNIGEPGEGGGSSVDVKMTLTAPGCGMGGPISMDAKHRIESLPGVSEATVEVVWDPPWNPQMISAEGRAKLGMED